MSCRILRLLLLVLLCAPSLCRAQLLVRLPTDNRKLFTGDHEGFFMYVDRMKDGVNLKPWTAGQYGIVRTVVETPQGPVCVKFHEGIDIKPLHRDQTGKPQDTVRPVAPGVVVHASDTPGHSAYGRYVVLRHDTPDGPLYSLYAHLGSVSCQKGDRLGTGNALGILGYSGVGLNKTRSHLHLELALMLNDRFPEIYAATTKTPDYHGCFNGLNLAGFDPVPLLKACEQGERPSLRDHLAAIPPEYTVRIPGSAPPTLGKTYPFLIKPGKIPAAQANSWDISFSQTGVPLALEPSGESVTAPEVIWLRPDPLLPQYRTCYRVKSLGNDQYALTGSGKRYLNLFCFGRDEAGETVKN